MLSYKLLFLSFKLYLPIGGGGGFGGDRGGGAGDMVTQEDTIFIQGMNPSTSEDELCQHFGAIGIIKVNKIFG